MYILFYNLVVFSVYKLYTCSIYQYYFYDVCYVNIVLYEVKETCYVEYLC